MPINCSPVRHLLGGLLLTLLAPTVQAATMTVTNCNDSGTGSLREAITSATSLSSDDTILFNSSANCTITLASTLPDITNNGTLTITGNGTANTIISGASAHQLLLINAGATLTLNQITLENGNAYLGGAINNSGTLNVNNSYLHHNATNSAGFGGAIYSTGTTNISDSTFSYNSATAAYGGAITLMSGGTLHITGSLFSYNSGGYGATIFTDGPATVSSSIFSNNTSTVRAGGILNNNTLYITNTLFTGNQANVGGALMNQSTGTLTVVNSTLSNNSAPTGGGLFTDNDAVTYLYNSLIANSSNGGECVLNDSSHPTVHAQNSLIEDDLSCVNGTNLNNLTGDPALNPDFTLSAPSIAVNGGNNSLAVDSGSSALTTDLAGNTRIQITKVDIGAYESPYARAASATLNNLSQTYDGSPKSASCTTVPSGLATSITYDGSATAPTNAGSYAAVCSITDPAYSGSDSQTFTIAKASQSVSFTSSAPGSATVGGATYNVTAASSSGLTVALTIDASAAAVCTLSGATVSFIGVGTCVIDANQAGNTNYNAASQVQQSFSVTAASATATLSNLSQTYDGSPKSASCTTVPSGLATSITYDGSTTAPTNAGSYAAVCSITDPSYSGSDSQTFTIAKASQSVSFTSSAPGSATVGGATYNVTAASSSGLTVALTIDASAAAVCTLSGATVSFIGVGTCVIDANQAGNTNYNAASQVQQSFSVTAASATATLSNLSQTYDGSPKSTSCTTVPSGLATSITYDGSTSAPTNAGSYAAVCTITDPSYSGSDSQTFTIAKAEQSILFGAAPSLRVGESATLNATGGGASSPVTFTTQTPTMCNVAGTNGESVTGVATGTCTVAANQLGDANYTAALEVTQSFTVNPATAVLVTPTGGLITTEAGGQIDLSVVLASPAYADVTISLTSSDTSEGTLSSASLLFTAANWDQPQIVTVTGQDDTVIDGSVAYAIQISVTSAADAGYDGISVADVELQNSDDDTAGIVITPTTLDITEGGATASFTLQAATAPTAAVTVPLTTDGQCTVAPTNVTLAANGTTAESVTVTAVDDSLVEGTHTCAITTGDPSSSDPFYTALTEADVADVTATITDNDNVYPVPTLGPLSLIALLLGVGTIGEMARRRPTAMGSRR